MRALYQETVAYFRQTHWTLLLFLILVLNVKMLVKVAVIVLMVLLNYRLFRDRDIFRQQFLWFYSSMVAIILLNLFFVPLSANYLFAVSVAILFWLLCIACASLISAVVTHTDSIKLHTTISLFFVLNALVTLGQLALIMIDAGSLNPYTYQGMYQKYFIGTGDLLTGISFDVSTTNALLNAFAVIYFLSRNKMMPALLCLVILLFTGSNFTNFLLTIALFVAFIFQSSKNQKSIIIACFVLVAIFIVRVSPQNNNYVMAAVKKTFYLENKRDPPKKDIAAMIHKPDSLLSEEEQKQKIAFLYLDSVNRIKAERAPQPESTKPAIPEADIHSEPYQRKKDTNSFQKELLAFGIEKIPGFDTNLKHTQAARVPGKLIAAQQTVNYFKDHPLKIITGSGAANFSSKLAFRATGLSMAGGYPDSKIYIHEDFLNNHLRLHLTYFSKDLELHSLTNTPNSVYDQLMAEYGLAGISAFVFFYIGFFFKHLKKVAYGIPLLILLMGAFAVEYWFEQLSIVLFFELLALLLIKGTGNKHA